ncbi:MAG: hypothetical protein K0R49_606, partial [Burkholderiales bacterium]|nr:hypothetical protein [Burkholderiales bacterium]
INHNYKIKNQFIKVKFNTFKIKTVETCSTSANLQIFLNLLNSVQIDDAVRLLGIGVHFDISDNTQIRQLELF